MRRHGIKSNFAFNVAGTIVPLVVALVTVPIYVSHIGVARYGVLSIVWILLGYFGFLDLGLSRASANALAKHEHSSQDERSTILITAFCMNFCLGTVGGVLFYFGGRFFLEYLLAVPAELRTELDATFPWISCLLPLALISGVASGALESRERFLTINLLQTAGSTVGQTLPVIAAVLISPSLSVVVPAAVLSRLPALLLILGFVMRDEWPMSLRSFDRTRAAALLTYGGWISVTNIASPIIVSLDQLVIGSVLGVASVSYYAVAMSLVTRSQIFAVALSRTLFPRMSRVSNHDAVRLTESAMVTLAYGYGAICAPAIVLVGPFIRVWMGPDFASIATPVAELLLVGAWINGIAFVPFAHLQGQGRPDIIAKYLVVELLPYMLVIWLLTREFGIIGAAYAWVLRTPVHLVFFLVVIGFPMRRFLPLALPFAIIIVAFVFVKFHRAPLIEASIVALLLGLTAAAVAFTFDRKLRDFLLSMRRLRRTQRVV